uniref:JmjC domain-containing protein n=1 Tax=Caenorhabditis tropicalis TaxID=1561998 RepID=A0A1I7USF7_9PELO
MDPHGDYPRPRVPKAWPPRIRKKQYRQQQNMSMIAPPTNYDSMHYSGFQRTFDAGLSNRSFAYGQPNEVFHNTNAQIGQGRPHGPQVILVLLPVMMTTRGPPQYVAVMGVPLITGSPAITQQVLSGIQFVGQQPGVYPQSFAPGQPFRQGGSHGYHPHQVRNQYPRPQITQGSLQPMPTFPIGPNFMSEGPHAMNAWMQQNPQQGAQLTSPGFIREESMPPVHLQSAPTPMHGVPNHHNAPNEASYNVQNPQNVTFTLEMTNAPEFQPKRQVEMSSEAPMTQCPDEAPFRSTTEGNMWRPTDASTSTKEEPPIVRNMTTDSSGNPCELPNENIAMDASDIVTDRLLDSVVDKLTTIAVSGQDTSHVEEEEEASFITPNRKDLCESNTVGRIMYKPLRHRSTNDQAPTTSAGDSSYLMDQSADLNASCETTKGAISTRKKSRKSKNKSKKVEEGDVGKDAATLGVEKFLNDFTSKSDIENSIIGYKAAIGKLRAMDSAFRKNSSIHPLQDQIMRYVQKHDLYCLDKDYMDISRAVIKRRLDAYIKSNDKGWLQLAEFLGYCYLLIDDVLAVDFMFLNLLSTKAQQQDLYAEYREMIVSFGDWTASIVSEVPVTVKDLESWGGVMDEKKLQFFADFINQEYFIRYCQTFDKHRQLRPIEKKIIEYVELLPEKGIEWSHSQFLEFINRRIAIIDDSNLSHLTKSSDITMYTFLASVKSSIVDFDLGLICLWTQNGDSIGDDVESVLWSHFFGEF